jgi:MFS family permease
MALLLGLGIGLPFFLGSAFGGVIVEFLGYRWLFAIFSLFSVASIVLYRSKGAHLKTIR